jgi:CBS domain-containing protein
VLGGRKASDFMSTDLVLLAPDADLNHAMGLLVEHDVSGAPVLDGDGALVGLLTEKDCFRAIFRANYYRELVGTVGDYMSAPVEAIQADTDVLEVVELFYRSSYRRFPVVAADRLVGLISRRDVLRAVQALW